MRELKNVMERFALMDGRLEFGALSRNSEPTRSPSSANDLARLDEAAVGASERKVIYELLLQKLIDSEAPSRPATEKR